MAEVLTVASIGWLLYRFARPSTALGQTHETFREINSNFFGANSRNIEKEPEDEEESYDDENPLSPSETAKRLCKFKGKGACLIETGDGNLVADLPDAVAAARAINEIKRRMNIVLAYIEKMVKAYDDAQMRGSNATDQARQWASAWYLKTKDATELRNQIEIFRRFLKRYPDVTVSEKTVIRSSKLTSFIVDKKEMSLCLRRDQNGALYDINTILYVVIHEFAHAMSINSGHDSEFVYNFAMLLRVAIGLGQYRQVDYSVYPINYCGLQLDGAVMV